MIHIHPSPNYLLYMRMGAYMHIFNRIIELTQLNGCMNYASFYSSYFDTHYYTL